MVYEEDLTLAHTDEERWKGTRMMDGELEIETIEMTVDKVRNGLS